MEENIDALQENNLYADGSITVFPDGSEELNRIPVNYTPGEKDQYHIIKDTDRLDFLAWFYYKAKVEDASKWWHVIADANNIENPLDLTGLVGTEIIIPDIENFRILYR